MCEDKALGSYSDDTEELKNNNPAPAGLLFLYFCFFLGTERYVVYKTVLGKSYHVNMGSSGISIRYGDSLRAACVQQEVSYHI